MEPQGSLPHSQVPANCPYPEPDQSTPCHHPTSEDLFYIILPSTCMLASSKWYLSLGFPNQNPVYTSPLPPTIRFTSPPTHSSRFDTRMIFGDHYRSLSSSLCSFLHCPVTLSLLGRSILLSSLFLNNLALCFSLNVNDQVSRPYKNRQNYSFKH
jgi:hypothetical protein